MTEKRVPQRQCMGCNARRPKKELIRIVRTPEGEIRIDLTGKLNGRGAYICPSAECFRKVRKSGRLAKMLETAIPDGIYDGLEQQITALDVQS